MSGEVMRPWWKTDKLQTVQTMYERVEWVREAVSRSRMMLMPYSAAAGIDQSARAGESMEKPKNLEQAGNNRCSQRGQGRGPNCLCCIVVRQSCDRTNKGSSVKPMFGSLDELVWSRTNETVDEMTPCSGKQVCGVRQSICI